MTTLYDQSITTALTAEISSRVACQDGTPRSAVIQAAFTYGSGGTSADAWIQTSVDGGVTWTDICNFHFTTSSARFVFNLSALTPVTTEYTPTDGTLAANTAKDGILGPIYRAKVTTVGTYAATTLRVDLSLNGVLAPKVLA